MIFKTSYMNKDKYILLIFFEALTSLKLFLKKKNIFFYFALPLIIYVVVTYPF